MVFELFLCLSHLFYFVCLLEFVVHVLAWTLKKKGDWWKMRFSFLKREGDRDRERVSVGKGRFLKQDCCLDLLSETVATSGVVCAWHD